MYSKHSSAILNELDIVLPCYNESDSIPHLLDSINSEIVSLNIQARVIIVDDGSSDGTDVMLSKMEFSERFRVKVDYLILANNVGQMGALQAGFEYSTSPFVISMDADQQHPARIIKELWNARNQAEVVSMRQSNRKDRKAKATASKFFYVLLKRLSGLDIKEDVGDFRIYSRSALNSILNYKECNKVFRFTIEELSIKQICLEYEPDERQFGESRYSFKKMFRLAVDSILGSSRRLLKISLILAVANILFSLFVLGYMYSVYSRDGAILGWVSILGTLSVVSAGLFAVLAILSLYVQRILEIITEKPRYRISSINKLKA